MIKLTAHISQFSNKRLIGGVILALVLLVGVFVLKTSSLLAPNLPFKVEIIPLMGQGHLNPGERPPVYNSNPPTSGLHESIMAPWGSYFDDLRDSVLIHDLEHGGIWISYKDATDADLILALRDIVQRYPTHVILTYRSANDSRIAVAAWGRLLKLDTLDEGQIEDFISRYRFKGPENL
ncbi:MAG: DUF3105 domain-containing protein [Aggregatilineales bacterium]